MPIRWQQHMVLQGFHPMNGTITELVDFCKRIESTKELPAVKIPVMRRPEKTTTRAVRKDPRNASPKGKDQVRTTVFCKDQTIPITQMTAMPSRILLKEQKTRKKTTDRKSPKGPKK